MINYFRASLANLAADTEQPLYADAPCDVNYIPYAYTVRTLDAAQLKIYNALFPVNSNRAGIVAYTNAYTKLLHAFNLDDVFTAYYPTINYELKIGRAHV